MDDSIAAKLSKFLGGGDGISFQTKRALLENAVLEPERPAIAAAPAPQAVGGPSPSAELLERVRANDEARAQESLRRIMEKRR